MMLIVAVSGVLAIENLLARCRSQAMHEDVRLVLPSLEDSQPCNPEVIMSHDECEVFFSLTNQDFSLKGPKAKYCSQVEVANNEYSTWTYTRGVGSFMTPHQSWVYGSPSFPRQSIRFGSRIYYR